MGFAGSDDAGVIRLRDDMALVSTVDFFTPIVDDPYSWGRIAAANALSDIYAMGADPMSALQLVGWPRDDLPMDLLSRVITGGADTMADAGCVIVGGHSIDDREPKYGFAVNGTAPVDELMTNSSAVPGQELILTKPLGTGIISTAIKAGAADERVMELAVDTMAQLNRGAASAARRVGVRTATDITGFGLLGHLAEVVRASGVSADIRTAEVPVLNGVRELAAAGYIPGGTRRNQEAVSSIVDVNGFEDDFVLLADAQTSGGLLLAIDRPLCDALLQALEDEGVSGTVIGSTRERTFSDGPSGQIRLI